MAINRSRSHCSFKLNWKIRNSPKYPSNWKHCRLTLVGKITVLKSCCLTTRLHENVEKSSMKINTLFSSFSWNGKGDKIKGSVMIDDYAEGDLKWLIFLQDFKSHVDHKIPRYSQPRQVETFLWSRINWRGLVVACFSQGILKAHFEPWCNARRDPLSCNTKFPGNWKPSKIVFLKSYPGHIVNCFTVNEFAVRPFTVPLQYFELFPEESEGVTLWSLRTLWTESAKRTTFKFFHFLEALEDSKWK